MTSFLADDEGTCHQWCDSAITYYTCFQDVFFLYVCILMHELEETVSLNKPMHHCCEFNVVNPFFRKMIIDIIYYFQS
jgi:hypothetical protein